jgi:hypothetical protein
MHSAGFPVKVDAMTPGKNTKEQFGGLLHLFTAMRTSTSSKIFRDSQPAIKIIRESRLITYSIFVQAARLRNRGNNPVD